MTDAQYLIRCNTCGKTFDTQEAKAQHKIDRHQPHRRFSSSERPKERGAVPCGYPTCDATFKTEWNAAQHRRDAHGEMITLTIPQDIGRK